MSSNMTGSTSINNSPTKPGRKMVMAMKDPAKKIREDNINIVNSYSDIIGSENRSANRNSGNTNTILPPTPPTKPKSVTEKNKYLSAN